MLIYISNELDGVTLKLSEEFPLGTDVIATVFMNSGSHMTSVKED